MVHKPENNYKSVLLECYNTDNELVEKWHSISPASVNECVEREFNDLKNANINFFTLIDNSELIGYFGTQNILGNNYLTGFFIKPEYRNKQYITQFWNCVNLEFNNEPFYSGVYKNNKRAYNFLLKNNGLLAWEEKDSVFIMMNWER